MTSWILLLSLLAVAHCRPQFNNQDSSSVEVEKQQVVEIHPKPRQLSEDLKKPDLDERQLEESTKEILAKIALVNEQQGLYKKRPKPYHYPFSYLRSQDTNRKPNDFKFPRDPFTNPILDYIEKEKNNDASLTKHIVKFNNNEEEDEVPPGQYIKRKITHQQTFIIPGFSNMIPQRTNMPQIFYEPNRPPQSGFKPEKTELEKQTIENIKNIVENSQNPYSNLMNLYQQNPSFENQYQMYYPYYGQQFYRQRQQWPWPFQNYFPIVIKDPFAQMMNALTTMIEYGPDANPNDSCKKQKIQNIHDENSRAKQISEAAKLSYSVVNTEKGPEISVSNKDDSDLTTIIDIEDLKITNNEKDPLELQLNLRQSKQNKEATHNRSKSATYLIRNPLIQSLEIKKFEQDVNKTSRHSPPIRDRPVFEDELEDDQSDKAEDISVVETGNKKLISKDNTGSGIFVHKIKVRKGGVAIAGPGGIATAGSGGTAIVGPNGFAYTHPDSLAIAGSGTKVIAVEPTISLSQVVNSHTNKTRGNGHSPTRLGKIVAVGPVIYYNKGYVIYTNGAHYPSWSSASHPANPSLAHSSTSFKPKTQFPQTNASRNQNNQLSISNPKEEVSVARFVQESQTQKGGDLLAPYKSHPFFHFLKNRNTVSTDQIISFRSSDSDKVTTLILKPMAKAVAGIEGKAISNPISRAILRRGINVDILFEPEAVAIVGPGGIAHAQSDLEISYDDFVES